MRDIPFDRKIGDLVNQCRAHNMITHTDFLDPARMGEAKTLLRSERIIDSGGIIDYERGVLFILPDYVETFDPAEYLGAVKIDTADGAEYSHRDYLGSLMSLGITREKFGDIIVAGGAAYVIGFRQITAYVAAQLERVSRTTVRCEEVALGEVPSPKREISTFSRTVAAMRADSVCGAVFGLSRSKAAEIIRAGLFSVNWKVIEKNDYIISSGDILSVKGMGRATVTVEGLSKKGRQFIVAERFGI